MKTKFIQCKRCKEEVPLESCELAAHRTIIDNKEYVFCCKSCAESYQQKRKE